MRTAAARGASGLFISVVLAHGVGALLVRHAWHGCDRASYQTRSKHHGDADATLNSSAEFGRGYPKARWARRTCQMKALYGNRTSTCHEGFTRNMCWRSLAKDRKDHSREARRRRGISRTLRASHQDFSIAREDPLNRAMGKSVGWNTSRVTAANDEYNKMEKREGFSSMGRKTAMQYLHNSVADLPRLTRQEETALAEDVQRWQRLERLRKEASGRDGEPDMEQWAAAAGISVQDLRKHLRRGPGARERLVLSHVRLVMYLARRRGRATALSPMDLIQEGTIALHIAVDRYDPSRGVRFFTYADWALRAAFEQAEASQAGAVTLPRYVQTQKRRLKTLLYDETILHDRMPTSKELAAALCITSEQLARAYVWANGCDSIDRVCSSGVSLGELLPAPPSLETLLQRLDAELVLGRLLESLKPQEAEVILHRYGLFGRTKKTPLGVAQLMRVSRQYVGRVHDTALHKMREALPQGDESRTRSTGFVTGRQIGHRYKRRALAASSSPRRHNVQLTSTKDRSVVPSPDKNTSNQSRRHTNQFAEKWHQ